MPESTTEVEKSKTADPEATTEEGDSAAGKPKLILTVLVPLFMAITII